jgi:hypothetical protein
LGDQPLCDGDHQLIWGTGVEPDRKQQYLHHDEWLDCVSVLDRDRIFLRLRSVLDSSDDGLYGAAGLVIDNNECRQQVGGRSHRITTFTKDRQTVNSWVNYGNGREQLDSPWGAAIDQAGFLYVADHRNHQVQKF